MLADLPSFFEIPEPFELFFVDAALTIAGTAVLIRAALRHYRRGPDGLFCAAPERPNRLWPEYMALPVLAFAVFHLALGAIFDGASEELAPAEVGGLLAGICAQLLSAVVCIVLASVTFERRARGFVFGDRMSGDQVTSGVLGLLASFPLCFVTLLLSMVVIYYVAPDLPIPQHDVLRLMAHPDTPGWVQPVLWASAVVIAPLAEEAFFRGICQTGLNHLFKRRAIPVVLVAVVFGLAHSDLPQFVAPLIVLGLILGYVYERTGSLVAPIMLHALFNLKTMIFAAIANKYVS